MENEKIEEREKELIPRGYELLSRVKRLKSVYVRDDQYDFPWLLDSARISRKKGHRFGLIDSGKLDSIHLEWLAEAGADIYTSDEARPNISEIELMNRATKRGSAIIAFFHHGPLEMEEKENLISISSLKEMGKGGIYIHLSNRERQRDFSLLGEIAFECRKGGSWLVYYHHGEFAPQLVDLARAAAWIHISDQSFQRDEEMSLFAEDLKAAGMGGSKFILHVEKRLGLFSLKAVLRAGAIVLFKGSLTDYRSPLRALERELERETRKAKLDFRAYYLSTAFLP